MNRFSRIAAAATITTGVGLAVAAPASAAVAAPAPQQVPFCTILGGTAYPPGACTFTFDFFGGSTVVIKGNQIGFKIGNLPPFTIVFGYLPGDPAPVQATADANGNATLALPTDGLPTGQVPLRVETPANGSVTTDVTVVSPDDPAGVAAANAAAANAAAAPGVTGTPAGAAGTAAADSTAAVGTRAYTEPGGESHDVEYAVLGSVLAGGVVLSTVLVTRRRRED